MMNRALITVALLLGAAGLASCQRGLEAPLGRGVCYHLVRQDDGTPRFNRVAENQPQLEYCAGALERIRRGYRSLGGNRDEVVGVYQGRWIFVNRRAIFTSRTYEGSRYVVLVRLPDGRLAMPGAVPRPIESTTPAAPAG